MATAERKVLTGGVLPVREGTEAEHHRLVERLKAARRGFERYQDHDSEIAYARASWRLEEFQETHPELAR